MADLYRVRWLHNGMLPRESEPMTKEEAEELAAEMNRRRIYKATVRRTKTARKKAKQ